MLRRHFMMDTKSSTSDTPDIPYYELRYTTNNNDVIELSSSIIDTYDVISNVYKNNQGIITFENDIIHLEGEIFNNKYNLTSVIIPNSVTTIGGAAFRGCNLLTSVNIPNGVTEIRWSTFKNCSSLTSIIIPNSVTSIREEAFENCTSLTSITIPNSVTEIGNNCFTNCNSLNNIIFEGTIDEWNKIIKGYDLNNGIPATVVHCTDGDVEI